MSAPFVAEIRMFGFNFPPTGWAFCNGQILPISQNTALFSLLGTTYGGNGQTTFALPNLQGSVPLHVGRNQPGPGLSVYDLGQVSGETNVTVLQSEMPSHGHTPVVSSTAGTLPDAGPANQLAKSAKGNIVTGETQGKFYSSAAPAGEMALQASGLAGSNMPHNNCMPSLVLNYCIAMQGIFPARN
ncbi:phage tail protein [Caulobacter sp. Root655]|uniref:phage tail protein n=1 Tax=Caulobacter sp. Root655 TaxID=1736578 RepID=UPI0006FAE4E1|nr:tail fiber protein [Caulobacter sp. Root655]KRA66512.1 phage tail protein [Caulobacter sp. Root655]